MSPCNVHIDGNGQPFWEFAYDDPRAMFDEEVGIQQYTGLLDKNGVEIYEGDIVEMSFGKYHWLQLVSSCERWGNNLFFVTRYRNFHTENGETTWGNYFVNEGRDLNNDIRSEVIGNVWENPELLNAKD